MRILALSLDAAGNTNIQYKLKLGEITTHNTSTQELLSDRQLCRVSSCTPGPLGECWRAGFGPIPSGQAEGPHLPEGPHSLGRCPLSPSATPGHNPASLEPLLQEHTGFILSVDSNDQEEIIQMLVEDEFKDAVLLVFANNQDFPNALNVTEIMNKLILHYRNWYIQATCYTSGNGLQEGLDGCPIFSRTRSCLGRSMDRDASRGVAKARELSLAMLRGGFRKAWGTGGQPAGSPAIKGQSGGPGRLSAPAQGLSKASAAPEAFGRPGAPADSRPGPPRSKAKAGDQAGCLLRRKAFRKPPQRRRLSESLGHPRTASPLVHQTNMQIDRTFTTPKSRPPAKPRRPTNQDEYANYPNKDGG
ncbi:hypothetical protein QTO34_007884 [Cnephaeus nilssonii]|uniref:Uncharacterized protein n=1 Tax=Cnephaeus nilssonii TaxID=3371016 RepID=A0AA40I9B2_CNENI|nr:hypothetical protein QTO34_007884 [Eptesicus nilssonii]